MATFLFLQPFSVGVSDLEVTLHYPYATSLILNNLGGTVDLYCNAEITGGTATGVDFEVETSPETWSSLGAGVYNFVTYRWELTVALDASWEGTWVVRAAATRSDLQIFYSTTTAYSYFTITIILA